jgi:hypothetical protein
MAARVDQIQERNYKLLQRGGKAIVDLIEAIVKAKEAGASASELEPAQLLQRKAQWRLDFIAAENSMGFHAPQEAARILGEAIDYARQGQVAVVTKVLPPELAAAEAEEPEEEGDAEGAQKAGEGPASPSAAPTSTDVKKSATPPPKVQPKTAAPAAPAD